MNIKRFNTIGVEEEEAALRVLRSKNLSGYVATSPTPGPEVFAFEQSFSDFFGTNSTAVNSATSGLLAACMACSVGPGHEVIVPPLTMSASWAVAVHLGATPVWCDVEPDTFNMDVMQASKLITENTRAIIVPNIFGCPADLHFLRSLCDSHDIVMIEDNAQSIMARENGVFAGTIGHMGVFSFNVHKHMQCGEGGMVVTTDPQFHEAIGWAMNHGEVRGGGIGLNLRMTEITAAIAAEQFKKLPAIVKRRQEIGERMTDNIFKAGYQDRVRPQRIKTGKEPVYYAWAADNDSAFRVRAHGTLFGSGYTCMIPEDHSEEKTPTPIAMRLAKDLITFETCAFDPTDEQVDELCDNLRRWV